MAIFSKPNVEIVVTLSIGPISPGTKYLRVATRGFQPSDDSINSYTPIILKTSPIEHSGDIPSTWDIVLQNARVSTTRQDGQHPEEDVSGAYLYQILQLYDIIGATAVLKTYTKAATESAYEYDTSYTGKVATIKNIDGRCATLRFKQTFLGTESLPLARNVATTAAHQAFEETKDKVLPINIGDSEETFERVVSAFYDTTVGFDTFKLGARLFGMDPSFFPSLYGQLAPDHSKKLYTNTYDAPIQEGGESAGFNPWVIVENQLCKLWSSAYTTGTFLNLDTNGAYYSLTGIKIGGDYGYGGGIYARVAVPCIKVHSANDVSWPDRAVDGKVETYATLASGMQFHHLDLIPATIPQLGRFSTETDEVYKPRGVEIAVLCITPRGEDPNEVRGYHLGLKAYDTYPGELNPGAFIPLDDQDPDTGWHGDVQYTGTKMVRTIVPQTIWKSDRGIIDPDTPEIERPNPWFYDWFIGDYEHNAYRVSIMEYQAEDGTTKTADIVGAGFIFGFLYNPGGLKRGDRKGKMGRDYRPPRGGLRG